MKIVIGTEAPPRTLTWPETPVIEDDDDRPELRCERCGSRALDNLEAVILTLTLTLNEVKGKGKGKNPAGAHITSIVRAL